MLNTTRYLFLISTFTLQVYAAEQCDNDVDLNNEETYQSFTGLVTCKDDSGGITQKINLNNGQKSGTHETYYPGGQLKSKIRYHKGLKTSQKIMSESGKLIKELAFFQSGSKQSNRFLETIYDENTGKKKHHISWLSKAKKDEETVYYDNGKRKEYTSYQRDGYLYKIYYYENGKKKQSGSYKIIGDPSEKNYEYNDEWKDFREDGSLKTAKRYYKGKLVSQGTYDEEENLIKTEEF